MPAIVTVNVSQVVASAPSQLQRTGAVISEGATILGLGTNYFLGAESDLPPILLPDDPLVGATWGSFTVTITTTRTIPYPNGTQIGVYVKGVVPTAYNTPYVIATVTSANTFTYPLADNPGVVTTEGVWNYYAVTELTAMVHTFFAQNNSFSAFAGGTVTNRGSQGVYVLECGGAGVADAVANLGVYLTNPNPAFYSYLVTYNWDQNSDFLTLTENFNNTTGLHYFYVSTYPTTDGTDGYAYYTGSKCIYCGVQTWNNLYDMLPDVPLTEFTLAATFYVTLNYAPSAVNLVSPLEWHYLYSVTAATFSPTEQNAIIAGNANFVGTGASGGISNKLIAGGNFMDGNPFNYWYAIDWVIINQSLALSAAVITGSNTPTNPLYYNQAGINSLQKVAQAVMNNGVTFGMILSPVTVTATPFTTYVQQHPGDYATGTYAGLAATFTPQRGFAAITINLTATNIPA